MSKADHQFWLKSSQIFSAPSLVNFFKIFRSFHHQNKIENVKLNISVEMIVKMKTKTSIFDENFQLHLCAIVRVYSVLDFHSDCEKLWENFLPTLSEKFSSEKYLNEIFLVWKLFLNWKLKNLSFVYSTRWCLSSDKRLQIWWIFSSFSWRKPAGIKRNIVS